MDSRYWTGGFVPLPTTFYIGFKNPLSFQCLEDILLCYSNSIHAHTQANCPFSPREVSQIFISESEENETSFCVCLCLEGFLLPPFHRVTADGKAKLSGGSRVAQQRCPELVVVQMKLLGSV